MALLNKWFWRSLKNKGIFFILATQWPKGKGWDGNPAWGNPIDVIRERSQIFLELVDWRRLSKLFIAGGEHFWNFLPPLFKIYYFSEELLFLLFLGIFICVEILMIHRLMISLCFFTSIKTNLYISVSSFDRGVSTLENN